MNKIQRKDSNEIKEDLEIPSKEASENNEGNSLNMSEEVFSENSAPEKIDQDQLFFNQKRERIKRKIEEEVTIKNNKSKEKLPKQGLQKGQNKNFIEKNSNVMMGKDKALTKRLNGMSVRINRKTNGSDKRK